MLDPLSPNVDHKREILRRTFDADAELYERARPEYPELLFDDLFVVAGLQRGTRVVEIGCGTGKATRPLARRECALTCLELGENLAAVARQKLSEFSNVQVIQSSFEEWEPGDRTFDVVFAACAWHWIDPQIRYAKAAQLLRRNGRLALIHVEHVFPDGFDEFFVEIQKVYNSFGESIDKFPRPQQIPDNREDIESSGRFANVQVKRYVWSVDYTAEQYINLLNTYSGHITMEPSNRSALYTEVCRLINARAERHIRKHYLAILQVANLIAR